MMEGKVTWNGGMTFSTTFSSGHTIILDAAPEVDGQEHDPRPMELLLLGLGGCTGTDVISILREMRQDVTGYQIVLKADRAPDYPKVFTRILVEHVVRGRNLSVEAVRRAVELSATRYCSASAMLGKVAQIEEAIRVVDESTGAEKTELAVTLS